MGGVYWPVSHELSNFIFEKITNSKFKHNVRTASFQKLRYHSCDLKMTLQTEHFSLISHLNDFNVNFLYNLSQLETIENIVEVTARFSRSVLPQNNNKRLVLFINELSAPIAE